MSLPEDQLIHFRKLGMAYRDYLKTPHWNTVRNEFLSSEHFKGCCNRCFRSDVTLNVHHRHYETLGFEKPRDLLALCDDCHKKTHDRAIEADSSLRRAHRKGRCLLMYRFVQDLYNRAGGDRDAAWKIASARGVPAAKFNRYFRPSSFLEPRQPISRASIQREGTTRRTRVSADAPANESGDGKSQGCFAKTVPQVGNRQTRSLPTASGYHTPRHSDNRHGPTPDPSTHSSGDTMTPSRPCSTEVDEQLVPTLGKLY